MQHERGHETTDVNPYYVGLFGLGLAGVIAIVLVSLYWTFWSYESAARRADPPPSPVAGSQTPPLPRLQVQAARDLAELRHEQERVLSTYDWIDRQQQTVRIPIDRAIAVLAERGLAEPAGPPPNPAEEHTKEPPAPGDKTSDNSASGNSIGDARAASAVPPIRPPQETAP
jgi:hypothetical protein